jgi:DNA-binding transcriptional LysR family regulator
MTWVNLQQLRYAVEVARVGSISKAAKNLFMGQPNLSKSIKELEEEVGQPLFYRTVQGVQPTKAGRDFLGYARSILSQMDSLTNLCRQDVAPASPLFVCVPHASYISHAFSRYAAQLAADGGTLNLDYRETDSMSALHAVAAGEAQLGIVRCQNAHTDYFQTLCAENGLHAELLWQYYMVLLMSEEHPLAGMREIPYNLLRQYTEIVHGDLTPVLPAEQPNTDGLRHSESRIAVYERGSQFDLLRRVKGSYMWVSPVPFSLLSREELVQKPCRTETVYQDIVIYRPPLSACGQEFFHMLQDAIAELVQTVPTV